MIYAGIDAGSRAVKIVLWDSDMQEIVGSTTHDQGVHQESLVTELFVDLARDHGFEQDEVAGIIATGYARNLISVADTTITEITCHACGVSTLVPNARTVIEIGGQDSKLLQLEEGGRVRDFAMNDRCAAGTGRFLEVVATRLEAPLDELGKLAAKSTAPATISSMCVVFAESEIIGLLASGAAPEDIVAGVQASIATRVAAMAGRRISDPVYFTGGVAMVGGMAEALAEAMGREVKLCPQPQLTGALGAAILASRQDNG